ncbi:MAG: VOC family protein [Candidatus Kapabacteria bacterium]|nr:VOC family protein [Candidatus Kapabacteria bacterium]
MNQAITALTLVVRDYDEAIRYYTDVLGFALLEDTPLSSEKRWVRVAPQNTSGKAGASILLAKATNERQEAAIGNQTGGRVFLFLHTDNFWRDYEAYRSRNVRFTEEPRKEEYGTVVVFKDLYGNLWDLVEPKKL